MMIHNKFKKMKRGIAILLILTLLPFMEFSTNVMSIQAAINKAKVSENKFQGEHDAEEEPLSDDAIHLRCSAFNTSGITC